MPSFFDPSGTAGPQVGPTIVGVSPFGQPLRGISPNMGIDKPRFRIDNALCIFDRLSDEFKTSTDTIHDDTLVAKGQQLLRNVIAGNFRKKIDHLEGTYAQILQQYPAIIQPSNDHPENIYKSLVYIPVSYTVQQIRSPMNYPLVSKTMANYLDSYLLLVDSDPNDERSNGVVCVYDEFGLVNMIDDRDYFNATIGALIAGYPWVKHIGNEIVVVSYHEPHTEE